MENKQEMRAIKNRKFNKRVFGKEKTQRDRETERRDRERDRQRERQTERETDRERDRQRYREIDRHENIQWAKCLLILGDNNEKNLEKINTICLKCSLKRLKKK